MINITVGKCCRIPRALNDPVNSFQKFNSVFNMWFGFAAPLSRMYTVNNAQLFREELVVAILHLEFQMVV
jgi:hypothetical protein